MKLVENKLSSQEMHESLIDDNPWGRIKDGKLAAWLVFEEGLSTNGHDVSVYSFDPSCIIDSLIDNHILLDGTIGNSDSAISELSSAKDSLKAMIDKIDGLLK